VQASLDEVSQQLADARNDAKTQLRLLNAKQKELDEFKENVNIEGQMRQVKHKQVRRYVQHCREF
jgi:rhodanese-related sulfurtransferase